MNNSSESPEEQKVRTIISDATKQTEIKKEQIKGPQPSYPGRGDFFGKQPGDKKRGETASKDETLQTREKVLNDSAKVINGAPVNTQAKAYKIADDFAYPETARQNDPALKRGEKKGIDEAQRSAMHQMGHTDMKARGEKPKDISESQDYAMRKLGDKKEQNSGPSYQNEKNQFKGASMSKSFSSSLGYSKLNKSAEKQPESRSPMQPVSMSGKFSATLGYNNMSRSIGQSSPAKGSIPKDEI